MNEEYHVAIVSPPTNARAFRMKERKGKQIKMLIIKITLRCFPFIIRQKETRGKEKLSSQYNFLIIIISFRCFPLVVVDEAFLSFSPLMNANRHEQKVINSVGHVALQQLRDDSCYFLALKKK